MAVDNKDRYSASELAKKYGNKSGYKATTNKAMSNSSFWLDSDLLESDVPKTADKTTKKASDYVKLAAYQRAISNFVRIVTGRQDIKVMYSSGQDSYTDGKHVVISAKIDEKEFDSTVGLALHEGSHCVLTDFRALSRVFNNGNVISDLIDWHRSIGDVPQPGYKIQEIISGLTNIIEDRRIDRFVYDKAPGYHGYYASLYDKYFNSKVIDEALVLGMMCNPTKWDDYNFHITNFTNPKRNLNALPALRKIWETINIPQINRLKSTSEVIEIAVAVYKIAMQSIHDELEKIAKQKELEEQIQKQKEFTEGKVKKQSLQEAEPEEEEEDPMENPNMDIPRSPVLKNEDKESDNDEEESEESETPGNKPSKNKKPKEEIEADEEAKDESGDGVEGEAGDEESEDAPKTLGKGSKDSDDNQEENNEESDDASNAGYEGGEPTDEESEMTSTSGGTGAGGVKPDKTKAELEAEKELEAKKEKIAKKLQEAIQEQKDFLEGKTDKKKLSPKDAQNVNAAADSEAGYEAVGGEVLRDGRKVDLGKINCLVVKGLGTSLIESDIVRDHYSSWLHDKAIKDSQLYPEKDYVATGIQLGKLLGNRLKTRDEERSLKTTRLDAGRIDKRLIAELGFGNGRVFSQTIHTSVRPGLMHISIDASGSMQGKKWETTMKTSIAIAQAASMISSLDCIISIRGSKGNTPLMWVVYDSRKDSLSVLKDKMYGLRADGGTPEGLCFEAIQKEIIAEAKSKDMYFINISDGAPGFSNYDGGRRDGFNYNGETAQLHTRQQVEKMKAAGIEVVSYFISETDDEAKYTKRAFNTMYGNSAQYINVTQLAQSAKSLNNLFERK